MKKFYQYILLLFTTVCLSACPYKEVYRFVSQTEDNGTLKISPVNVYYKSFKGFANCGIVLKFNNQRDSIQKVTFLKSYLINVKDTLKIENIYAWTAPLPANHVFNLPPKKDTTVEFMFRDLEKNFGDTIKIILNVSGVKNETFIYKKRKK